jgi:hypothetical protein
VIAAAEKTPAPRLPALVEAPPDSERVRNLPRRSVYEDRVFPPADVDKDDGEDWPLPILHGRHPMQGVS